jgi:hypothetical protein
MKRARSASGFPCFAGKQKSRIHGSSWKFARRTSMQLQHAYLSIFMLGSAQGIMEQGVEVADGVCA